ncbi:MAG: FliM/FliN family flagellar motor switch protein [Parasphingorhabdus sp.]|nr:FliM/FliN family flagellar motor switch protein [Parasphingorhabdus sp.]
MVAQIEPFTLARSPTREAPDHAPLERASERLAEQLAQVLHAVAGAPVSATYAGAEQLTLAEWQARDVTLASLLLYRLIPLKGFFIMMIEGQLISQISDLWFGGKATAAATKAPGAFRNAERLIIDRVATKLGPALAHVFAGEQKPDAQLNATETVIARLPLAEIDTKLLRLKIAVSVDQAKPLSADLFLTAAAVRSALETLDSPKARAAAGPADPLWSEALARNLDAVHLPLRSVYATTNITMPQLFALSVGDFLPLNARAQLPLYIGPRKFAAVTLGEKDGAAAVRIEQFSDHPVLLEPPHG